jgi:hypothetical protein
MAALRNYDDTQMWFFDPVELAGGGAGNKFKKKNKKPPKKKK